MTLEEYFELEAAEHNRFGDFLDPDVIVHSDARAPVLNSDGTLKAAWCPGASPPDNSCSPSNKGTGSSTVAKPRNMGEIFRLLSKEGGFTYNPRQGESVRKGWAVSVQKQREKRFDDDDAVTVSDLIDYWDSNAEAFSDPENYLGGWVDKGVIVLDIARTVDDRDEAIRLAKGADQDGIFNLETKEFVATK